jgi:hypothetical protein
LTSMMTLLGNCVAFDQFQLSEVFLRQTVSQWKQTQTEHLNSIMPACTDQLTDCKTEVSMSVKPQAVVFGCGERARNCIEMIAERFFIVAFSEMS